MDRLVKFEVLGTEFEAIVSGAANEQEAREVATTQIAKALHSTFKIKSVKPARVPEKRISLWQTYSDGFKSLFSFEAESTALANATLDEYIEEVFGRKIPKQ